MPVRLLTLGLPDLLTPSLTECPSCFAIVRETRMGTQAATHLWPR